MYFLVLVYLLLYIKLDFKVYLRQNTPALASSSRRGGRATEPRPGVRPSACAPGPGERRRAAAGWGPPASRAGRPNAGAQGRGGRPRGAGDAGGGAEECGGDGCAAERI